MWYEAQNGSLDKPGELDKTSSGEYVYVRKDFAEIPESVDDEQPIPAHYKWMEAKISKADWELYEKLLNHDSALDDVYAALTELAGLIAEE